MAGLVADSQLEGALLAAEAAIGVLVGQRAAPLDVADASVVVRRVEALARQLTAVQVAVLGEIERRRLHVGDGHRSARALVGHAAQLSPADASRRARAARALAQLPEVAAALRSGRVGVSQVDRIARVHANARVREQLVAVDAYLAVVAERLTYEELDRHLAEWERLADVDGAGDRAERCHRRRDLTIRQNLDGSWRIEGGCGSLQGVVAAEVLDAYVRAEFEADWAQARGRLGDAATVSDLIRTDAQRRMDAFERVCLDAADATRTGTGHAVVTNVVVDQQTLEQYARRAAGDEPGPDARVGAYWSDLARTQCADAGDGCERRADASRQPVGPRCTTLDGRRIDPSEALAAALVAQVRRVVLGADSVVIDLGRRARLFTGAAHLAVHLSRTQCYWPGCHVVVGHCQADHLQPWDSGGRTDPGNGAPACGMHNRFRNHGFTVHRDADGSLHVHRPDGSSVG